MHTPITHRRGSTWLITPGSAPDRFDAARGSGAEIALLDLEDSVPDNGKGTARRAAIDFLVATTDPGQSDTPVLGLRVNAVSTVHGLRDLVALAECGHTPAVVLVPKVESSRDIELVAEVLNLDGQPPRVWALIETPRAIERLPEILRARPVAGVVFGAADYAAVVGCSRDRRALRYPRSALAASAAAAGVPAIDSPFFDLHDLAGLRRDAEEARDLGFVSKGAVHPAQLAVIKDTFTPSAQQLAGAQAVIAAEERAQGGITTVGGQMVGPPLVAHARSLIARTSHTHGPYGPGEAAS